MNNLGTITGLGFDLKSKKVFATKEVDNKELLVNVIDGSHHSYDGNNQRKYSLSQLKKYHKNSFREITLKDATIEDTLGEFDEFVRSPLVEGYTWVEPSENTATVRIRGLEPLIFVEMIEKGKDCVIKLDCLTPLGVLNFIGEIIKKQVSLEKA